MFAELDVELKMQEAGEFGWRNLDTTLLLEYYPPRWVDLAIETVFGIIHQTNKVNSFEASPRLGIQLLLLSGLWGYLYSGEQIPIKRLIFSNLLRYEYQNLWHNQGITDEYRSLFRARIETKFAINHHKINVKKMVFVCCAEKYFDVG